MVYCTKCGTQIYGAKVCANWDAAFYGSNSEGRGYVRYVRYEREHDFHRRSEALVDIVIGLILFLSRL